MTTESQKRHNARRPTTRQGRSQRWRDKIQASKLLNQLHKHAMGEIEMTATQVNAAKILIGKVYPDLKSVDMQVTDDRPAEELSYDEIAERLRSRVSASTRRPN